MYALPDELKKEQVQAIKNWLMLVVMVIVTHGNIHLFNVHSKGHKLR